MICNICKQELEFNQDINRSIDNFYYCTFYNKNLCYPTIIYEDLEYFKIWHKIKNSVYLTYYTAEDVSKSYNLRIKLKIDDSSSGYKNLMYKNIYNYNYKLNLNLNNIYDDLLNIVEKNN